MKDSPTFMEWTGVKICSTIKNQLWIPKGFAHGYLTLSKIAIINYKVDNYYNPEAESGIPFDDNFLKIDWKPGNCCSYFYHSRKTF